jgi:hypothetical protein
MSYRKITIDNEVWKWKCGSRFVKIVPPVGPSVVARKHEVMQMSEEDLAKAQSAFAPYASVGDATDYPGVVPVVSPRHVRSFILARR